MAFLAAVHDELLRDPGHALAAYYPTTGGAGPGPGLGEAFSAFCADRAERLAATLATRRTQTNEVARCGCLLPAFAAVAGGRPLALIEIGASAGLNLLWDHYAYDYGDRTAGVPSSPLTIACELVGPHVPPLDPPPVAWRVGVDLAPVDASDPADARWLRACLWPDQPARQERLAAALAVAREHPGRGPPRRRAGRAAGADRRGAGGRARLRLPHRRPHLLRARADRGARRAARGGRARRRLDRRRGRRRARRGPARAGRAAALRARRRPARRARPARAHGPPRRLAGVVRELGVAALVAPGGVAEHVAAALEVRGPADLAAEAASAPGTAASRPGRRAWPRRGGRGAAARRAFRRANGIVLDWSKPGPESGPSCLIAPPGCTCTERRRPPRVSSCASIRSGARRRCVRRSSEPRSFASAAAKLALRTSERPGDALGRHRGLGRRGGDALRPSSIPPRTASVAPSTALKIATAPITSGATQMKRTNRNTTISPRPLRRRRCGRSGIVMLGRWARGWGWGCRLRVRPAARRAAGSAGARPPPASAARAG